MHVKQRCFTVKVVLCQYKVQSGEKAVSSCKSAPTEAQQALNMFDIFNVALFASWYITIS